MKGLNTPATAKEGYLRHDCKQYGFPSATLKSLDIQNRSVPWPATNLEMIQKFLFDMPGQVSYIPKSPFRIGQMVVLGNNIGRRHWGSISFFLMAFFCGQTPDLCRILSEGR